MTFRSRVLGLIAAALAVWWAVPEPATAQPSGSPIRIGGTLALTGPLAAQTIAHKLVGELFVEQLNKKGGLLGRPVEFILLDDQAKPELARTLYERLLTVDKVDLIIGAFGSAANLGVFGVAQRYGKIVICNSMAIPKLSSYPLHFPVQGLSGSPEIDLPNKLFDALATTASPPKRIGVLGSKFPSIQYISEGVRDVAIKRGLQVPLYLEYEFGTREYGPIAARVKDADPDFLWVGGLGVEGIGLIEAMKRIGYSPKGHVYLFPAAGAFVKVPEANNAFSFSAFEQHPPLTDRPGIAEFVQLYNERAAAAGLPYVKVEHQAAIAYAIWQVLKAGVEGAGSLDDKAIAQWLKTNTVPSILGTQRFNTPNNYGDDLNNLVQLQNGSWVTVYPANLAAPGAKLNHPIR